MVFDHSYVNGAYLICQFTLIPIFISTRREKTNPTRNWLVNLWIFFANSYRCCYQLWNGIILIFNGQQNDIFIKSVYCRICERGRRKRNKLFYLLYPAFSYCGKPRDASMYAPIMYRALQFCSLQIVYISDQWWWSAMVIIYHKKRNKMACVSNRISTMSVSARACSLIRYRFTLVLVIVKAMNQNHFPCGVLSSRSSTEPIDLRSSSRQSPSNQSLNSS